MSVATLIACQFVASIDAFAINKCEVDGKMVFQDMPCKNDLETGADRNARMQHYKALYIKLDYLAAQGKGLVQRQPAAAQVVPPPQSEDTLFHPKSRDQQRAERQQKFEELQEKSAETNAKSAATLTGILDAAKQACGDKLIDYPTIGMSDETFRNCTTHARFGGITQLVVSEDGKVPLRLYIFPTQKAQRVYSIGGVITAIKP